ncbi:hypothetical protein BOX15_Mlig015358g3 [Macrostomum lignano]|uniref:Transcription and mRNA export factor ENY2 n=1 Tax=Macrostomum lignano TaxID=282301 RepID=A0A267EDR7_9PLAT|nr:hypothetical protein BOX15_Mlig015358g3 [Macrostomum lignano]
MELDEKRARVRAQVNQRLIQSGERERLKELLRTRLNECGWREKLKQHCKEIVRQKGLEQITVDDLVAEITPKGRALVPDEVKKELLQRIKSFLAQTTADEK